jgi:desulfoferrodoxin (superoxide reductase-like protein)
MELPSQSFRKSGGNPSSFAEHPFCETRLASRGRSKVGNVAHPYTNQRVTHFFSLRTQQTAVDVRDLEMQGIIGSVKAGAQMRFVMLKGSRERFRKGNNLRVKVGNVAHPYINQRVTHFLPPLPP